MSDTLILERPGVLSLEAREPVEPAAGEVRVRLAYGGICGSDLHYFLHGGFGKVRMTRPMVLGHELSGVIEAVGVGVDTIRIGEAVAVDPSLPCGACAPCRANTPRFCRDMRFMGSAMRTPPVDGGFRQHLTCRTERAVPFSGASLDEAALAEPLAVCLHALSQAPDLSGRRVMITGFGPIGALCLLAARQAGAAEVIVTDISEVSRATAIQLGADRAIDSGTPGALNAESADFGRIDVSFECSAHPGAIADAIAATRQGGTIVQVGMLAAETIAPLTHVVTKELIFRGTFRFDAEFVRAVDLIARRSIDVRPLITDHFPLTKGPEAFVRAQDRNLAMKVLFDLA